MKRHAILACLLAVITMAVVPPVIFAAAQLDFRYFPETGHNIRAPFLYFFESTGGLARYGYPITEDFVDPQTRLLVQYFQNVRMEWHPENPDPYKVQLGLLGEQLGKRVPPLLVKDIPRDPNCLYFKETGHAACWIFREYWLTSGGLDMFGYPITEIIDENGMSVQYFQRARMEWHPENPAGQRVQVAPLGEIYYRFAKLDPERPRPVEPIGSVPTTITSIRARGSVLRNIISPGGTQVAYVYVSDQLGRPLANVAVTLIVNYPGPQGVKTFQLPPTATSGTTSGSFNVGTAAIGKTITMEFIISYPGVVLDYRTRASYMVWYY